jgi:hypothetical protein
MGIILSALIALAVHSGFELRSTDQLDPFAMLRIGASVPDYIQTRMTDKIREVKALDRVLGWIGDATEGEGDHGERALGVHGRLSRRREFAAYDLDEHD